MHIYVGPGACTAPSMHIYVIPGACTAQSMHIYVGLADWPTQSMHICASPAVPGGVFRMLPGSPGFLYFGWLSGATLKSVFSLLIFVDCALRRPRALSGHFPGTTRGGLDRRNLHIFA